MLAQSAGLVATATHESAYPIYSLQACFEAVSTFLPVHATEGRQEKKLISKLAKMFGLHDFGLSCLLH